MNIQYCGSIRDPDIACSALDRQELKFDSCVWRVGLSVILIHISIPGKLESFIHSFIQFSEIPIAEYCLCVIEVNQRLGTILLLELFTTHYCTPEN